MKKGSSLSNKKGFSLVEAIIATAIFAIIIGFSVTGLVSSRGFIVNSGKQQRAAGLAEEGLEAARNIRDNSFDNLADGTHGISGSGSAFAFAGSSDSKDIFTRKVYVSTVDATTKEIKSEISWQDANGNKSISLTERLSNWKISKLKPRKGILVYGDGGTSTDAVKFKTYNDNDGSWSSSSSVADIDPLTANKYLRAVRIYASGSKDEKILISRHFDGSKQYIYAQVYDGSNWGSVQLLSSWTNNQFLDVQNFDGTYLDNGDFMAVYSDFTTTPKYRIWNGSSWGSEESMRAGQAYPVYITTKARPKTNEVMVVVAGQGKRTETQYYNGSGYSTGNWTLATHATNSTSNAVRFADFDWSPNDTTKGALVYETNTKFMTAKIFSSSGATWSTAVNAPSQTNNVLSVSVAGRVGANEFMACNEDNKAPDNLTCYLINSFTPTFSTPVNNILTTGTVTGNQYSLDFDYNFSGLSGLSLYSNNSANPQLRTYDPAGNSFSAAISAGTLNGIMYSGRILPNPASNDAMLVFGDKGLDVETAVFDGTNNIIYTTPSGKALTLHGSSGSATTDYWYDFVWDQN